MSKPRKIKLTISNPCFEDWNKMKPVDGGRFCKSCNNLIRDFSNYTDRELTEFLPKAAGKVCGQFCNSQLNRLIPVQESSPTPIFRKLLFSSAILAGVASAAHGQNIATPNSSNGSGHAGISYMPPTTKSVEVDTSGIIKGRILDAKTKHPLANAKLMVELDSVHYSTVYTDSTGHYSINIPSSFLNKKITLFPRLDDYENTFKTIVITKFPLEFNFRLHKFKFDEGKTVGYLMM